MKFLILILALFATSNLWADEEIIKKVFDETKQEIKNILADKSTTEQEKNSLVDKCKKRNLLRLENLSSFYVNRMKFNDSKIVKEAIAKFKSENFTDSPATTPEKVASLPPKNKSPESENQQEKPEDKPITEYKKGNNSYLERKKEGVTAMEFLALPQDKKDQYIKKFVTKDADGFFTVNKGKYIVKTDVSAEYTMEKAIFMDDFYIAFERIFYRGFSDKSSPTLIITKTRLGYFDALKKRGVNAPSWSGGLYYSTQRLLAGFDEVGAEELMNVLLHEGTHQLMDYYTKKDLLPWFNEGIATNFETWDIYKSPQVNIFNNQFSSTWLEHVAKHHKSKKYTLHDFKFLLNLSYSNWNNAMDPSDYYAQGWSMINFLLNSPDKFKVLDKILVGFMNNQKIEKILSEKEIEQLGNEWLADLNNRIIPLHQQGKDIYLAIQEWVKTKKYNENSMKNKIYQLEKTNAFQVIEFKYLSAMHKMITGQLKEALADLQSLTKMNEDLPYLYSSIAYCQNQLEQKEEAKKNIAKALHKDGYDILALGIQ